MKRVDLATFNLNLLVALDALLHARSVSVAAREAGVTPSAMSHSLGELRELLGDPLLVRAGRGMALSPRAEALARPLRALLRDVDRVLAGDAFEPATAERRFVIAAPDFLAVQLLPALVREAAMSAPGVTFDVVPSARRGNAWLLESGDVDLAVGAVVADAPGIRKLDLYTEGFACAARADHPTLRGGLDLDTYCRVPHLVITLGDDDRPTWIDEALAALGRTRHVAARVRYFMAAPLVVAETELLMTGPRMLIRYFAERAPLAVFDPPIELPTYPEEAYWHERFDEDPGHRWLRAKVRAIAKPLGLRTRPTRRVWREPR